MLLAPLAKVREGLPCQLVVHHFEKRLHYVLLGLDFSSLSAQCGAVLLEISVGLLAYADG